MAHPDKRNDGDAKSSAERSQADLSARLQHLDARLERASANRERDDKPVSSSMSNQGALGQAFKLSAEFVSGPIAGGLLGWGIDKLFGSAPWGILVCVLLGFGAGLLNLARSAGIVAPRRGIDDGPGR